jgi:hypothetical protein
MTHFGHFARGAIYYKAGFPFFLRREGLLSNFLLADGELIVSDQVRFNLSPSAKLTNRIIIIIFSI